jgi:hypothetical protein
MHQNIYPSKDEKIALAENTKLDLSQIESWLKRERQKKKKESPWGFSACQSQFLMFYYSKNQNPNNAEIKKISADLSLDEKRIISWFSRTRFKQRLKS